MIKLATAEPQLPDFNVNKLIIKANKTISDEPTIKPINTNSDMQCIQPGLQEQEEHLFEVY